MDNKVAPILKKLCKAVDTALDINGLVFLNLQEMGTIKSSEHKAEMKFVGSLDRETNVNVTIIVAVDDSPFIDKLKYSYKEKIAKKQGISREQAKSILAATARKVGIKALHKNPRLKKILGVT